MTDRLDLTKGGITDKLVKLSVPIMATSFIQMAYSMIDMIWVGKAGSDALAAVGTASFYPWLAFAFIMIAKIGGEVRVAQSIGTGDYDKTKRYIKSAIEINLVLAALYTLFMIGFNRQLIGFFRLGDVHVEQMAQTYLVIVGAGMVFFFMNPVFTAIFNGLGNSKLPFRINTIGLIANIILDPIFILGFGPIPALGVAGAAIATVISQIIVFAGFIILIIKQNEEYFKIRLFKDIEFGYYKELYKLGLPVALQSGLFTMFSMVIGVIVAAFSPVAVAVQKVGSQIESVTWMTADGIAIAIGSFVGQNYGANEYSRIDKVRRVTILICVILGTITTALLIFFGEPIFKIFLDEPEALHEGIIYLRILGYSQLFMCIEILVGGFLRGLGRTYIPSVIITGGNALRIPLALILSQPSVLGLQGVWWSITISTILKGILLMGALIYLSVTKKLYRGHKVEVVTE